MSKSKQSEIPGAGDPDINTPITEENGLNSDMQVVRPQSGLHIEQVPLNDIDSLDRAEAAPVDIMSDYWTPAKEGESKKVIFDRIDLSPVLAQDTGEIIDLECFFGFIKEDGKIRQIRNGSKRLVGALQAFRVERGAALLITYLGKKQNRTNSFKSDNWSVQPLVIPVKPQ